MIKKLVTIFIICLGLSCTTVLAEDTDSIYSAVADENGSLDIYDQTELVTVAEELIESDENKDSENPAELLDTNVASSKILKTATGEIRISVDVPETVTQALGYYPDVRIAQYSEDNIFLGLIPYDVGQDVTVKPRSDVKSIKVFIWTHELMPLSIPEKFNI